LSRHFRSLILCYHGVSDAWTHSLAVRRRTFELQVRSLLWRGFRPVDARDAMDGHPRLLHVTFDDAFTNIEAGIQVLQRLGVPATVFACPSYADDGRPLDVPEVAAAAAEHPEHMVTMKWDELGALAERGIEVGSHTLTHPHLPRLSDAELRRELLDSRGRLEDELRRPCRYVAYPFGDDDERVHRAAEQTGYEAAFSLRARTDPFDRYAIPRVDLYRKDTLLRTTLKTSLARRPAGATAALLRGVRRPA
jgi:peptidoglycan/xylan/chitin deacetylase (PgdA/CDA1 family)